MTNNKTYQIMRTYVYMHLPWFITIWTTKLDYHDKAQNIPNHVDSCLNAAATIEYDLDDHIGLPWQRRTQPWRTNQHNNIQKKTQTSNLNNKNDQKNPKANEIMKCKHKEKDEDNDE